MKMNMCLVPSDEQTCPQGIFPPHGWYQAYLLRLKKNKPMNDYS